MRQGRRVCARCVSSWQSWPASGTGQSGQPVPNLTDAEVKSPQVELVQCTPNSLEAGQKVRGKIPTSGMRKEGRSPFLRAPTSTSDTPAVVTKVNNNRNLLLSDHSKAEIKN